MSRRAFVVVLDACGVGALPDAAAYGDAGASTLPHLAEAVGGLDLPVLGSLGLGSIVPIEGVPPAAAPAIHGRLHPLGAGKESTTGHWELMGVVPRDPMPTYPDGFPEDVLAPLRAGTGLEFCCNAPYSGTEVLDAFGEHHLATGEVILYTSADSVLQLAAHIDVLDEPALYAACEAAREVMTGEHAVGRVIARPFDGAPGAFHRREGRRDYAVPPPGRSYLEELQADGVPVHGVGKIWDLFAGVGVDVKHKAATNAAGIAATTSLLRELDGGLVFVNLVETDQLYGHRHDVEGFHGALREIDAAVGEWLSLLRDDDLLLLTADHGVDPTMDHTDHTREYAPLLAVYGGGDGERHDGPLADVGASVLRWLSERDAPMLPGASFLPSSAALIAEALAETDDDARGELVAQLHERSDAATFALLRELVEDNDADARSLGADALGQFGYQRSDEAEVAARRREAIELLARLCAVGETPEVLDSVIVALGHLGASAEIDLVLAHVGHADEDIRVAVAWTLPSLGFADDVETVVQEHAAAALVYLADDAEGEVREWALFGLANSDLDSPELRELFVRHLVDPADGAAQEAMFGLARRRDERAIALVRGMLGDPDKRFELCVEAAAHLGDERLLLALQALEPQSDDDVLLDALRTCDPAQRAHWDAEARRLEAILDEVTAADTTLSGVRIMAGRLPLEYDWTLTVTFERSGVAVDTAWDVVGLTERLERLGQDARTVLEADLADVVARAELTP